MSVQLFPSAIVIDLFTPHATCNVCGEETESRWGIPVANGEIVPNDFVGEWDVCLARPRNWKGTSYERAA